MGFQNSVVSRPSTVKTIFYWGFVINNRLYFLLDSSLKRFSFTKHGSGMFVFYAALVLTLNILLYYTLAL